MEILNIDSDEDLAAFLKKRRKELRVTQEQLAELTGLSINGISKVETRKGSITLTTLLKIAPLLGFQVSLKIEP